MNHEQLRQELSNATNGLLLMSETDAPFEFYYHEKPEKKPFTAETVVAWDGKPAGTSVQTIELDEFFRKLTTPHPEAEEPQQQAALKYKALLSLLKEKLQDVKVYKVSEFKMPVYILGKTSSGDYAGLKTLVVET